MAADTKTTIEISAIDSASRVIRELESNLGSLGKTVSKAQGAFVALGSAFGAQQFASAILGAFEAEAAFVRLGEVAGTTASAMSAFDLPARLAGVSLDSVATSVAKLGKSIGEARLGDAGKTSLLKALGIDVNDGRDAASIYVDVARAVSGFSDQAVAGKVTNDLLGKSFAEMRPLIKELAEQETLMPRLSDDQAAAAKRLKRDFVELGMQNELLVRQFSEGLIPALHGISRAFIEARDGGASLSEAGETLGTFLKGIGSAGLAAQDIFFGLGHQIGGLGAAITAAASGNFKQAVGIIKDADNDVLQHTIATNARIASIWEETASKGKAAGAGAGTGGASAGSSSLAEAAVKERAEFEKHFQERIAQAQGFYQRYADAVRVGNTLTQEAQKQGVLGVSDIIEQERANEAARLTMLIDSLQKQRAIYQEMGGAQNIKLAQEKTNAIEQARAALETNDVIAKARQTSNDVLLQNQLAANQNRFDAEISQMVKNIELENMTELQLLDKHLADKRSALDTAAANDLIGTQVYLDQRYLLEFNASLQRTEVERKQHEAVRSMEVGTWQLAGEAIQAFAGKSRAAAIAAIAINKGLAIAQTIQNTAGAVMRAMFELGPIAGAAAAVGIEELGAIQIGLIAAAGLGQAMSTGSTGSSGAGSSFGIAAATPGGSGSVPAAPPPAQSPVTITVNIVTNGNIIGVDGARQLVDELVIPGLNEAFNSRDVVIIGPNSRQALNLADQR